MPLRLTSGRFRCLDRNTFLSYVQGVLLLRTNEGQIDQQAAEQLQQGCGWDPTLVASLQASKFVFDLHHNGTSHTIMMTIIVSDSCSDLLQ